MQENIICTLHVRTYYICICVQYYVDYCFVVLLHRFETCKSFYCCKLYGNIIMLNCEGSSDFESNTIDVMFREGDLMSVRVIDLSQ